MISKAEHPSVSEHCAMRSESRCALIKGDGNDIHERLYKP
jgi:hypothetical protein